MTIVLSALMASGLSGQLAACVEYCWFDDHIESVYCIPIFILK